MNTVHDLHQAYIIFQQEKMLYLEKCRKMTKKINRLNLISKVLLFIAFLSYAIAAFYSFRAGQIFSACAYSFITGMNLSIFICAFLKKKYAAP